MEKVKRFRLYLSFKKELKNTFFHLVLFLIWWNLPSSSRSSATLIIALRIHLIASCFPEVGRFQHINLIIAHIGVEEFCFIPVPQKVLIKDVHMTIFFYSKGRREAFIVHLLPRLSLQPFLFLWHTLGHHCSLPHCQKPRGLHFPHQKTFLHF